MPRASGRRLRSAEITSSPLPSPSRMSTTAKAGDILSTWTRPSATVSAVVTAKPRPSMARASRCRNDLSSSTISSERSGWVERASSVIAFAFVGGRCGILARRAHVANQIAHSVYMGSVRQLTYVPASSPGASGCRAHQRPLEIGPPPAHLHHRAALRELAVLQCQRGARALQQRLGDEEAQPQPRVLARRPIALAAAADERLAHAVHDLGREARAVVVDGDADR